MDFFEVVKNRKSVRVFTQQKIEPDLLTRILRAVQSSPTAGNLQAYQVYQVETPELIAALARAAYNQGCVSGAPIVLVFCADAPRSAAKYHERGADLYCVQDTTIAATLAHLAAAALGLGSVMVGAFDEHQVAQIVGAPATQRPILLLPLGYPDEIPTTRTRRSLDDLVTQR